MSDFLYVQEFKRRRNMRRYLITSCLVLAVFTLMLATQAKADSIDNFIYQAGGNTYTWQLPSSPTISPDSFLPCLAFAITDVNYSENDIPQDPAALNFLSLTFGGGLSLNDLIHGISRIISPHYQIYGVTKCALSSFTWTC